jgi:hypothetical protein
LNRAAAASSRWPSWGRKSCDLCQNTDGIEEKLVRGGRAEIGMTVSRENLATCVRNALVRGRQKRVLRETDGIEESWWGERVQKPRLKEKASEKVFALVRERRRNDCRLSSRGGSHDLTCCAWECGREWMMPFNFDRGSIGAGGQQ